MVRGGKAVRSRTDYILGTDRSIFRNVAVRDPRHNSDHYMVMGLLRGGTVRENIRYIVGRRTLPLTPPKQPMREDSLFGDMRRAVTKPQPREQHRNKWISEETWRLVDERVTMRRQASALPSEEDEVGKRAEDVGHCERWKAVRSRTDYILGTDRSLFRNVAVRYPRHNSDHYMVMGLLRGVTVREHIRYIAGRRRLPLKPPNQPTRED